MAIKKMEIIFNKETKLSILKLFDKTIDEEGFIVEKSNPAQRVLTSKVEEITIDEFSGIKKGSELFIKSDISSLIEYADQLS